MSQIDKVDNGRGPRNALNKTFNVKSIQFGITSPEAILARSVIPGDGIVQHKFVSRATSSSKKSNSQETVGTLADPRLAATKTSLNAITMNNIDQDEGNFGHMHLARPMVNPLMYQTILDILKVVCFHCSSVYLRTPKHRSIVNKMQRSHRLKAVQKLNGCSAASRFACCNVCGITSDKHVWSVAKVDKAKDILRFKVKEGPTKRDTEERILEPEEVYEILEKISDDDIVLMGFDPKNSRPAWMMFTVFPISPPTIRPSVAADDGKISDDDLTQVLRNIIKFNNMLTQAMLNDSSVEDIQNFTKMLQLHIAGLIDNETSNYPSVCNRKSRTLVTIKGRHKGKTGRVRGNMMGKRSNYTARTVISADPKLKISDVGMPRDICMIVTFPEVVSVYNYEYLMGFVLKGPTDYPGANEIRFANSSSRINLSCLSREERARLSLKPGDIVYRHLIDNDPVVCNRQPTLHKFGFMCHYIKVLPAKSMRLSVNITTPYGADFDGDEMHALVPQNEMARREIEQVILTPKLMVSPQSNKPVIGAVQDTMLSVSRMSSEHTRGYSCDERHYLNLSDFMYLASWIRKGNSSDNAIKTFLNPPSKYGWTSLDLLDLIIPDISITKTVQVGDDEKNVVISRGRLHQAPKGEINAPFTKPSGLLSTAKRGLVHTVWNDIGSFEAADMLDNFAFVGTEWLLMNMSSVSLRDFMLAEQYLEKIEEKKKHHIERIKTLVRGFESEHYDECREKLELSVIGVSDSKQEQFENDISFLMRQMKDECQVIAKDNIEKVPGTTKTVDNGFMSMVRSGSKGKDINMVSMVAMLGHQDQGGSRMGDFYSNRPLPFTTKFDVGGVSRGLISQSYFQGLQPYEYIAHAMAGRNGVISTSIATADTGYVQRKLMKRLELLKEEYDGTVRGGKRSIVQFAYNGDGYNGCNVEYYTLESFYMSEIEVTHKFRWTEEEFQFFQDMLCDDEKHTIDLTVQSKKQREEVVQLWKDRKWLKKHFKFSSPDSVASVVHFDRLIAHAEQMKDDATYDCVTVLNKLKQLSDDLHLPTVKRMSEKHLYMFMCLLRLKLGTKKLLLKHQLSKRGVDYLFDAVYKQFYKGLVPPGEAVGALAAQSIGEPTTQMTLDTFHSTGAKSSVMSGVPRVKQILSLTKTKKDNKSFSTIVLNPTALLQGILKDPKAFVHSKGIRKTQSDLDAYYEKMNDKKTKLLQLASAKAFGYSRNLFLSKKFREIVQKSEVVFLSKKQGCLSDHTNPVLRAMSIVPSFQGLEKKLNGVFLLSFYIKKEAENDKPFQTALYAEMIKDKLDVAVDVVPICLVESRQNAIVVVVSKDEDITSIEKSALELSLTGISGIVDAGINVKDIDLELPDTTVLRKGSPGYSKIASTTLRNKRWEVITSGSNLHAVLMLPEVQSNLTYSSDIQEITDLFGIEAGRASIAHEFFTVMEEADAKVDRRHINLLADSMTSRGFLQKIDRNGARKGEAGPISKASFEQTTKILSTAAMHAEMDDMQGVSANIACGQFIKQGTTGFRVMVDEEMIMKYARETPKLPVQIASTTRPASKPQQTKGESGASRMFTIDELFDFQFVL